MQRPFTILIAIVAWFAVITQFWLMMENRVASITETITRFLSFFTILTNTIVALFFTGRIFNWRITYKPGNLTAVTVYILIVGLVYQFILRAVWEPTGLQMVVDELLHTISPLLVAIYWYGYENKAKLKYGQITGWLIYPMVYFIYVMIRGSFSGFYPYPFVDVKTIGFSKALLNGGLVMLVVILVSFILVAVGKKLSQKSVLSAR